MRALIRHFGRLRIFAAVVTLLPLVSLPLMGVIWLWQSAYIWYWLGLVAGCGLTGFLLHLILAWREKRKAQQPVTEAGSHWPPSTASPWESVQALAAGATPKEWPLNDGPGLWRLGRDTLETVARHYHPDRTQPLLELTVPHALLIIERASRELRQEIIAHVPLSHRLTLGTMSRARAWKEHASRLETLYRVGYGVVDPTSALFREFRREMGNRILGYGSDRVQTWLLQEYVRKVGYYAIELYSGQLLLEEGDPLAKSTRESRRSEAELAEDALRSAEPLRILVLGRANAGKSSLINALFGELKAAQDIIADTTGAVTPYQLERQGLTHALILDTPGCDTPLFQPSALKEQLGHADLVLWVTAAHRPDRQEEREQLDRLRQWLQEDVSRRPAPLTAVMTHIDRLRPVREWSPPYDLEESDTGKAASIRAAAEAVAADLALAPEQLVPVSLKEGASYNVDDALWAAILQQQPAAEKARFLRCISERRREENWSLLWQQLRSTGRLLRTLPRRF